MRPKRPIDPDEQVRKDSGKKKLAIRPENSKKIAKRDRGKKGAK